MPLRDSYLYPCFWRGGNKRLSESRNSAEFTQQRNKKLQLEHHEPCVLKGPKARLLFVSQGHGRMHNLRLQRRISYGCKADYTENPKQMWSSCSPRACKITLIYRVNGKNETKNSCIIRSLQGERGDVCIHKGLSTVDSGFYHSQREDWPWRSSGAYLEMEEVPIFYSGAAAWATLSWSPQLRREVKAIVTRITGGWGSWPTMAYVTPLCIPRGSDFVCVCD